MESQLRMKNEELWEMIKLKMVIGKDLRDEKDL